MGLTAFIPISLFRLVQSTDCGQLYGIIKANSTFLITVTLLGDEDCGSLPSSPSFSSPNNTAGEEDVPVMTVLFSGITYLGSSSVDAPISEIEANRKMHVLKEQAVGSEPIPVVLSVPVANSGCIVLKDPKTDQPMATFSIKTILFCARGNAEVLLDCFCFNVRNKRSGLFQCHVFRTDTLEIVSITCP